ncbi:MAG: hypothetical protein HOE62_16470 [Alphaproteobacteria bacterium]|jgi:hypothetical protein|nr:hypothetical protein [Alphaproteobacteria bacterium]
MSAKTLCERGKKKGTLPSLKTGRFVDDETILRQAWLRKTSQNSSLAAALWKVKSNDKNPRYYAFGHG